jgi:hypothetical protein
MNECCLERRFVTGFRDKRAHVRDEGDVEEVGTYDERIIDGDLPVKVSVVPNYFKDSYMGIEMWHPVL